MSDQIVSTPERRERFLADAHAAAAVSHPNIVTLYEVGEDAGRLYLVYEFVQGQTLKNVIGGRPLNPRRALDLASQIAEALADAHAADLVHGAITAETIVITPKGHAKITGFGLAGWMGTGEAGEAGRAGGDAGYRADLSSLGGILFEMLTGRAPAPGAGVPSAVNRSLPREIDPIVGKALGKSGGYETRRHARRGAPCGQRHSRRAEGSERRRGPVHRHRPAEAILRDDGLFSRWLSAR